jgi:hypothetical protein
MSALIAWGKRHPYLAAWIALAIGMVALLVWEARDVAGLQPGQWLALVVATILVAGACIWIISWDSDEAQDVADGTPAPQEDAPRSEDVSVERGV